MEIALLRTQPIGNGAEISVNVSAGVTRLVLLRKTADTFTGYNDAAAAVVLDLALTAASQTWLLPALLDGDLLENGATYWYRAYGYTTAWLASASASITITPTLELIGPDPLDLIRQRLSASFATAIRTGLIHPRNDEIEVLTAPPQVDHAHFPVVTVHLEEDRNAERGIGECLGTDRWNSSTGLWESGDGWLSRWQIAIVGWSQNPEERRILRGLIKRTVLGLLPVLEDQGILLPELSLRDSEDMTSYGFPMYLSQGALTCLAPAWAMGTDPAVSEVNTTSDCYDATIEERLI